MAEICDLEPFRYDAESVDPITLSEGVAQSQAGAPGAGGLPLLTGFAGGSPTPKPTNSINNGNIEGYLNRLREALCNDITAIEARLDALEGS